MKIVRKDVTVLVVDDDLDLREAVASDFTLEGYQTKVANSGDQALQVMKQENIDVVVSDVKMPGMDGITLLREIRAIHPTTPIVFLVTGYADVLPEEVLRLGGQGLFLKPFYFPPLYAELERLLKKTKSSS